MGKIIVNVSILLFISAVICSESPNPAPTLKCYTCNSTQNANCIDLKNITLEICTDSCFARVVDNDTIRGCTNDEEMKKNCQNPDCQICTKEGCNNQTFSVSKCLTCNSKDDGANCTIKDCNTKFDKCFTRINDEITYRGCYKELDEESQKNCSNNPSLCKVCKNDNGSEGCNKNHFPVLKCLFCDSKSDINCIHNPSKTLMQNCTNKFDKCFTRVDADRTYRGCLLNPTPETQRNCSSDDNKSCYVCDNADGCNDKTYPESAGKCLICKSANDTNCAQNPSNITAERCDTKSDSCFTRIVGNETHRGCINDEEMRKNCEIDPLCKVCKRINGTTECNNEKLSDERLSCFVCESNLTSDCSKKQNSTAVPCKLNNDKDECYVDISGDTIKRGCLSHISTCHESNCTKCSVTACNSEVYSFYKSNQTENVENKTENPSSSAANFASTAYGVSMAVLFSLKLIF